jgi:hypothetical protein
MFQPLLNRFEQPRVQNRLRLAYVDFVSVNDLAEIESVLE